MEKIRMECGQNMSSYFMLELDTTAPLVEIYAPNYTTTDIITEIRVVANEELSPCQEIYIIDNSGIKHDLTFLHSGNQFIGYINFHGFDFGIVTIYARVKDTVHNISALVSHPIHIMESQKLNINISKWVRNVDIKQQKRNINIEKNICNFELDEQQRNISTKELINHIYLKVE